MDQTGAEIIEMKARTNGEEVPPDIVLVVEDEKRLRDTIRNILEDDGFRVITAADAETALQRLELTRPDLILSDINMPGMDGFEFFKMVQGNNRFRFLPFIFLTGLDSKEDVQRGKKLGVDDYLTKPFDPDDLLAAVNGKMKRMTQLEKSAQEELEKIRGEILTSVTHEFRTPISIMQSFISLIMDGYTTNEAEIREFLKVISLSGDRLTRMVENFLALVALRSGQAEEDFNLGRQEVELGSLVRQVLDEFTARPSWEGVELEKDLEPAAMWCMIHKEMIHKAFIELLENAVKFSNPEEPRIGVRLRRDSGRLILEVEDNGAGVPETEVESIFEEMYQFNRGELEQQGSGLGLTISRGYARLNGGEVAVEESGPSGSVFRLVLPETIPSYT